MVANDDDATPSADQRRREVIALLATGAMRWHRRAKATGLVVGTVEAATHAPTPQHQEEADIELELGEEAPLGLSASDRTARERCGHLETCP